MKKKLLCVTAVLSLALSVSACSSKNMKEDTDIFIEPTEGRPEGTSRESENGGAREPKELVIDEIKEPKAVVHLGDAVQMPESVEVAYHGRPLHGIVAVAWDEPQVMGIDTGKVGAYTVEGRLEDGTPVSCQVVVARKNWLRNPGFEKNDISMWKISYKGDTNPTDIQKKESDAMSGANSLHFWSEGKQNFKIEQSVSGLEAGNYSVSANIQGGDVGPAAKIYLYAVVNGRMIRSKLVKLSGWCKWKKPKIAKIALDGKTALTIGMKVKCAGGGWGTTDDFTLIKTD